MLRRTVIAPVLLAAALLTSSVAFGAGSGGRIDLDPALREYDSRSTGNGRPVTFRQIGAGVFMVWAFFPVAPGTAVIHPCNEPAPTDEATFVLEPETIQYSRFATAEPVCLTSTVPTHVIVDRLGTTTATPEAGRLQYVPLPAATTLFDGSTTKREQVVRIPRPAKLPGTAGAAVVSLDVPASDAPGFVTAYGCDALRPQVADVSYQPGARKANVAYVPLGPTEDLCVFALAPADLRVRLLGHLSDDGPNPALLPPSWRYVPSEFPAPSLDPIVPVRVLDTRFGIGRPGTSKVVPDEVVEIDFGARVGPDTTAVVLNVTVDQPESEGFVTAWPCGGDRPTVSNLNFTAAQTVPNLVIAKLGPSGTVCLSGIARTHLIADLNGTFETTGGLRARSVDPSRILDTREPIGVPTIAKVAGGTVRSLPIGGPIVPAEAGAVTVNVTVTEPESAGFVTVYPCDQPRPTASNLNFGPGQTVANLVTAKLAADGSLCLFSLADTHLVADIAAWYGSNQPAGLVELAPERYLDTREAIGVPATGKVGAGRFIALQVAGVGGVPADATAVVMNVTATETEADGFVTVWPCGRSMPVVSNLNYRAGETKPNLVTVRLSATGTVCLFTLARSHLLADVSGFLTDQTVIRQGLTLTGS